MSSCCAPGRDPAALAATATAPVAARQAPSRRGMVRIPAGTFAMGYDGPLANPGEGEGPVRTVTVDSFLLDATAVTNRQFATFVKDTGYVTDAERYGWSFAFSGLVPQSGMEHVTGRVAGAEWWYAVRGAFWKNPEGHGSHIGDRPNHPVVHVSWQDAHAYCKWAGVRMPTEAEWEYAARGGLEGAIYPWGDELTPRGRWRCNIWQGTFPSHNTADDGHLGAAPVKSYPPNGFGLYEMTGNVWEFVADRWTTDHDPLPAANPAGPTTGDERVRRGGSYLCHDSYCNRYRVAARDHSAPHDTSGNIGFRCASDTNSPHTGRTPCLT